MKKFVKLPNKTKVCGRLMELPRTIKFFKERLLWPNMRQWPVCVFQAINISITGYLPQTSLGYCINQNNLLTIILILPFWVLILIWKRNIIGVSSFTHIPFLSVKPHKLVQLKNITNAKQPGMQWIIHVKR